MLQTSATLHPSRQQSSPGIGGRASRTRPTAQSPDSTKRHRPPENRANPPRKLPAKAATQSYHRRIHVHRATRTAGPFKGTFRAPPSGSRLCQTPPQPSLHPGCRRQNASEAFFTVAHRRRSRSRKSPTPSITHGILVLEPETVNLYKLFTNRRGAGGLPKDQTTRPPVILCSCPGLEPGNLRRVTSPQESLLSGIVALVLLLRA